MKKRFRKGPFFEDGLLTDKGLTGTIRIVKNPVEGFYYQR